MIKFILPLLFAAVAAPHAFAGDGCGSCSAKSAETEVIKVATAEKQSGCTYASEIATKVAKAQEKSECSSMESAETLVTKVAMADESCDLAKASCDLASGCDMKETSEVKVAKAEDKSCGIAKVEETKVSKAEKLADGSDDVESMSCCPLPLLQETKVARAE